MPPIVFDIINLLSAILRLIGMAVLGLTIGWLSLDLLRKAQAWQLQIAIFLGFIALAFAAMRFLAPAALGAFGIGVGVAIFLWGMPKKEKIEEEKS
jgi:NhaP-type Na+/H+ or K+/H+ antiporter